LREIGFNANGRLLEVQRTSCDCAIGEDTFAHVCAPVVVDGQRGPAAVGLPERIGIPARSRGSNRRQFICSIAD